MKHIPLKQGQSYSLNLSRLALPCLVGLALVFGLIFTLDPQPVLAQTDVCFVETNGDTSTDFQSADAGAVQAAVDAAAPNALLKIAGTCAGVTVRHTISQTVYIDKALTVQGGYTDTNWLATSQPEVYPTTLDAQRGGRVAVISGTIKVTLAGLTITGGGGFIPAIPGINSSDNGAGIWSNSVLTVTHTRIISNEIPEGRGRDGGGLAIQNGVLYMADATIMDNENRDDDGGGMIIYASQATLRRTVIENNRTRDDGNQGGGIHVADGSTVEISDSTLRGNRTHAGSSHGAGLYMGNSDVVTISNSLIEKNESFGGSSSAGLYNLGGVLSVSSSTIQNNHTYGSSSGGGGVRHSGGTTTITNSNILSNTTAQGEGGGIFIGDGNLFVSNSTLAYNRSFDPTHPGGGLAVNQFGNNNKHITLENVTLSGNSSTSHGGGIWLPRGFLTMTHVTMSNNTAITSTGGISVGVNGSVMMQNSIIANSTKGDCANAGTLTDGGYNLIEDGSCLTAATSLSGDPLLGPLTNNGGETQTHALLNGSPALDRIPAGMNGCGTTITADQRGIARPNNERCDVGAFEFDPSSTIYLPLVLKN